MVVMIFFKGWKLFLWAVFFAKQDDFDLVNIVAIHFSSSINIHLIFIFNDISFAATNHA